MSKSRFPGKSQNKIQRKVRLSYKDTGGSPNGINELVVAAATNLRAVRSFFPADDDKDDDGFIGFDVNDPLYIECKLKAKSILLESEKTFGEDCGVTSKSSKSSKDITKNFSPSSKPQVLTSISHFKSTSNAGGKVNGSSSISPVFSSTVNGSAEKSKPPDSTVVSSIPKTDNKKFTKKLKFLPDQSSHSSRIITPNKKFINEESKDKKPDKRLHPDLNASLVSHSKIVKTSNNSTAQSPKKNGQVPIDKITLSASSVDVNNEEREDKKEGHLFDLLEVQPTDGIHPTINAVRNTNNEVYVEKKIEKEQESMYANRTELVGACIVPSEEKKSLKTNGSVKNHEGIIVCGICQKIRQCMVVANNYKLGIFLCGRCYEQSSRTIKKINSSKPYSCVDDMGLCLSRPDLIAEGNCCDACFSKHCLLTMDITDDIYFKIWRLIPDSVKESLPPTPSYLFNEYPNRGKFVYIDKEGQISSTTPIRVKGVRKIVLSTSSTALTSGAVSNASSDVEQEPPPDRQVKRLLPNDNLNFKRVKGVRVKQVSRYSGIPAQLPVATFKDLSTLPSTSAGFLRSGKFSFASDGEQLAGADEEILFGRQKGTVKGRIKALVPFEMEWIEKQGFPVVLTGSFPPKPLCFLCGSAGIQQLIFCMVCCEPYHPFCAGDDTLMSYVIDTIPRVEEEGRGGVATERGKDCCESNEPILLSPPLTPLPFLLTGAEGSEGCVEQELREHVLAWTCRNCILCKSCGQNGDGEDGSRDFVKCAQCREPHHATCVQRKGGKTERWICGSCCKCRSCGKALEGKKEAHSVNVSVEDGGDEKEGARGNHLLLCLHCFKKRQKGSFCPICQVCYDDNDYDTKMMECAQCERWIHAKCESISDEQYHVLGTLPECIEYICKVCDKGNWLWRRAIMTDMISGCERVLRIFQKNAITSSRKRKSLTLDLKDATEIEISSERVDKEIESVSEAVVVDVELEPTPETTDMEEDGGGKSEVVKSSKAGAEEEPKGLDTVDISKYNLKACSVVLEESYRVKPCSVLLQDILKCRRAELAKVLEAEKVGVALLPSDTSQPPAPKSPEKGRPRRELPPTPTKMFTPSKPVTSFLEGAKSLLTSPAFQSIEAFRKEAACVLRQSVLDSCDGDDAKLRTLLPLLDAALKEVFPWLHLPDIELSQLDTFRPSAAPEGPLYFEPGMAEKGKWGSADSVRAKMEQNPFEDIYWDGGDWVDERQCSFCSEKGDFPPNSSGRLLWAGLNDWVHINCAVWSSEVWEEETGALQQVNSALMRSRNSKCVLCGKKGASVSCCHSACHDSYHFLCSIQAGCALLEDKTLFCPNHLASVKGDIQEEMHVMRKVFVDVDWLRKKGGDCCSSEVKVLIGSLRLDRLGYIVPISVTRHAGLDGTLLVPLDFRASRLYWSRLNPLHKVLYSFHTGLQGDGMLREAPADQGLHITVNHSWCPHFLQKKLGQVAEFHAWVDNAPRYYDEYNVEWIPPCPLHFGDVEDFSFNDMRDYMLNLHSPASTPRSSSLSFCGGTDTTLSDNDSLEDCLLIAHFRRRSRRSSSPVPQKHHPTMYNESGRKENQRKSHLPAGKSNRGRDILISQLDGADDDDSSSDSDSEENSRASGSSSEESSRGGRNRRTTRQTLSNSKALSERTLRSRVKQPKLSVKKQVHKCPGCKKPFQSKSSINRHVRFCKNKSKKPPTAKTPPQTPTKSARGKKGEPKAERRNEEASGSSNSSPAKRRKEKGSARKNGRSVGHRKCTPSAGTTTNESDSETPSPNPPKRETEERRLSLQTGRSEEAAVPAAAVAEEKKEEEEPVRCVNCQMTYRTSLSYAKHLNSCVAYSSTTEDETESKEAESPPPPPPPTQMPPSPTVLLPSALPSPPPQQEMEEGSVESGAIEEDEAGSAEPPAVRGREEDVHDSPQLNYLDAGGEEGALNSTPSPLRIADVAEEPSLPADVESEDCRSEHSIQNTPLQTPALDVLPVKLEFPLQAPLARELAGEEASETSTGLQHYAPPPNPSDHLPIALQPPISTDADQVAEDSMSGGAKDYHFSFAHSATPLFPPQGQPATAYPEVRSMVGKAQVGPNGSAQEQNPAVEQQQFAFTQSQLESQQFLRDFNQIQQSINNQPMDGHASATPTHLATLALQQREVGQHGLELQLPPSIPSFQLPPALPAPNPAPAQQFQTLTLQDSNGQLLSVQVPINSQSQPTTATTHYQQQQQQQQLQHPNVHLHQQLQFQSLPQQQMTFRHNVHPAEMQQQLALQQSQQQQLALQQSQQQQLALQQSQQQQLALQQSQQQQQLTMSLHQQMGVQQHAHPAPLQHQHALSQSQPLQQSPFAQLGHFRPQTILPPLNSNLMSTQFQMSQQLQSGAPAQLPNTHNFQHSLQTQQQTLTDSAGTSYYIVHQGPGISQQLSTQMAPVPPQHDPPGGIITMLTSQPPFHVAGFSPAQCHSGLQTADTPPCTANASPSDGNKGGSVQAGSYSSNPSGNSAATAHPCPCSRCQTRVYGMLSNDALPPTTKFPHKAWTSVNKRGGGRAPKPHLVNILMDKKNRGLGTSFPKLLPATVAPTTPSTSLSSSSPTLTPSDSILCQALGKMPVSSPNVAVVRPMEHPLQKLSDQVSQMESSFNGGSGRSTPILAPPPATLPPDSSHHQRPATTGSAAAGSGTGAEDGPSGVSRGRPKELVGRTVGLKRKAEGGSTGESKIKVTLSRKEGGHSYSIKNVNTSGNHELQGSMRSLKIKAKITSGEQAGTLTDVVVLPTVHTIPTPDSDSDTESNVTVAEDSLSSALLPALPAPHAQQSQLRLKHRAVVVYEVKCQDAILYRSSDVRSVWSHIFETVQGTRLNHNLPPLSYPATNISRPEKQGEPAGFNMLGLTHRAVQFLLEQLPGSNSVAQAHEFRHHEPPNVGQEDSLPLNATGCARTEPYSGRKPFDMFGWLASKHRTAASIIQNSEEGKGQGLPLAMRFRNLKEKSSAILTVYRSAINGRGLYTRRDIEKGEMIIEYAGEVIRPLVCDEREKYYESKGIGCYMFRINDELVVDATMKGNAARFINHSCEPNCESKSVKIWGNMHILIFALRKIKHGEELTYDYKFNYEDDKIPCTCGSKKCRKYLN